MTKSQLPLNSAELRAIAEKSAAEKTAERARVAADLVAELAEARALIVDAFDQEITLFSHDLAARLEIVAREGRRQLDKEICITLFGEPPFVRARFLGNPTLDGPTRENVAATTGYKALERICDQLGYQVTVGSVRFTKGFYRVERVSPYAGAIERAMSNKSQASRFCVTVSVRF